MCFCGFRWLTMPRSVIYQRKIATKWIGLRKGVNKGRILRVKNKCFSLHYFRNLFNVTYRLIAFKIDTLYCLCLYKINK